MYKLWTRLRIRAVVPPKVERELYINRMLKIEGIRPDWSRDDSPSLGPFSNTGTLVVFAQTIKLQKGNGHGSVIFSVLSYEIYDRQTERQSKFRSNKFCQLK